ncbi:protein shuttle craft [Microplitis demolitor]|uniref:protein shuttle craft n=1 Tax=Microplitis demolitor TaxID=69319 RepID=UPI000440007E|nr:protein shuttle craft [Microplitis demolitor]
MATWDGSYSGDPTHEDSKLYYYYSNSQNPSDDRQWNHYTSNDNQLSATSYTDNTSTFSQTNKTYYDLPSSSIVDNSNCYFENNRKQQSSFRHKTDGSFKNNDYNIVRQSNLHPGANEFIPSNANSSAEPSKIFFPDNRSKQQQYGNRKYDNKKNNYRQQDTDYPQNSYKGYEKYRKKNVTNNNSNASYSNYSNNDYESHKDYPDDSYENTQLSNEIKTRDKDKDTTGSSRAPYNGRRPRSHGRYNSNSNSDYKNNGNNSARLGKNINHSNSNNCIDENSKQPVSRDPRDERYYRGFNNDNNLDDDKQTTSSTTKKDKKPVKNNNKEFYGDDLRDDRYRSAGSGNRRDDYYEEKNYRDKPNYYYRGYRDNYERDVKSDNKQQIKEENISNSSSNSRAKEEFSKDDNLSSVNWRQKKNSQVKKVNNKKGLEIDDAATQKESLTEQLNRGKLECLVCCEYIRQNDPIWSCNNCYHVLHLKCIKKWAESSQSESGWRCPACQNINLAIPDEYYCFCGKTKDPEWNRRDIAHSCGEICGRTRAKNNCIHKCTLLCHPGSCPLCLTMVKRFCGCGKTYKSLKCSTDTQLSCSNICDKLLNCKQHKCEKICHHGDCDPCEKKINQHCYCGKENRHVDCLQDIPLVYSCGKICNNLLDCGNHNCNDICHENACNSCPLKPETVTHCCCGKTPLTVKRDNCLDPIPTCDEICSKKLKCGQPSSPHTCKVPCHSDDCPPCDLTTWVKCRCGNMDREILCVDLTTKADDARCQKKCVKKRSCGKHKCNQLCCIDIEHICPLPCSKTLSCGKHKCELTCHKSRCPPCYRSSFDELYCECGAAVIYPPVPCGTRRPTCSRPCSRQHSCGHQVIHNCHSETSCPPCTVLSQKWCYGKHELRKAVPCYFNELSCGMPCGKPLRCGRHKCITLCHPGPCEKPKQLCTQPCTTPRELCGHNCGAPCHDGKCPPDNTPCKEMVKVTCTCGHRTMTRACAENSREYQRIASGILASKMIDMQLGHSVDLEQVFGQGARKQNQLRTLECNDECKTIERNRKLALGLQIVNPDLSGKLLPRYSDYMKQWAKKDPSFCQMVHEKLTELVQLAKTSKQKSRSYSFDSMNRDKRHFVHEACEHFGCESQAYDQEPKRNVVATAVKDKCWLPSYSLLEMVQRESGQRKVPRPMLNTTKTTTTSGTSQVLPSTASKTQKLQATTSTSNSSKSSEQEIDYFDYPNANWK